MRPSFPLATLLVALAVRAPVAQAAEPPADLVIVNAHVWTVDDRRPEAEAVAVSGGRIVLVGTSAQARTLAGPRTRVVDAGGRLLLPGFHDGHAHFIGGGRQLGELDLRDATSHEEFGRRIAEYARRKPAGEWITGGNWDHDKFPGGELPTAALIDRYVSDHPVLLDRFDGHMSVANTAALKAAGITAATADPEGGLIVRKPGSREPAGVLKDAAAGLVARVIPALSHAQLVEAAGKAFAEAARLGLTTIHDMVEGADHVRAYEALRDRQAMTARIYGRWPIAQWRALADRVKASGFGDDMITVRSLKGYADGSIGSSTALLFQPYVSDPSTVGLAAEDWRQIPDWAVQADAAGLQLSIHAIGDRAIYEVMNMLDRVERTNGMRDRRPRIEHDQHTHPRDFARHVQLGAIASVQPYHAIDDGRFVEGRIGRRRCQSSYAFRTFIDTGARMNFGSDWPVAPLDPILGIDAAVNRRTLDGKNPQGWFPEQKITVAEAIRAYTLENAYAAFMEDHVGSIAPGKYGDLVLLDRDVLRLAPEQVGQAKVDMTVLAGRVVYERKP